MLFDFSYAVAVIMLGSSLARVARHMLQLTTAVLIIHVYVT